VRALARARRVFAAIGGALARRQSMDSGLRRRASRRRLRNRGRGRCRDRRAIVASRRSLAANAARDRLRRASRIRSRGPFGALACRARRACRSGRTGACRWTDEVFQASWWDSTQGGM